MPASCALAIAALAIVLMAAVPEVNRALANRLGPYAPLTRRLAGFPADPPQVAFRTPVDQRAMERAGRIIPRGATYIVEARGWPAEGVPRYDHAAAARLYVAQGVPVDSPAAATWTILVGPRESIAAASRDARVRRLGATVLLAGPRRVGR